MTKRNIRYDPTDDLYAALGVLPSATTDELRRSFRRRAKAVTPDRNRGNPEWAHAQFQRVNDAPDILTDSALRAEYDMKRRMLRGGGRIEYAQSTGSGARRSTSKLAQASRAAWAHRRRRRGLGSVFFVAFLLFAVSCWMLQFPQNESAVTTSTSAAVLNATSVVIVAANLSTPALDVPLSPCDADATISTPLYGAIISGPFSIPGTASGRRFAFYSVYLGIRNVAADRVTWFPLVFGINRRVENGLLVPDGLANLAILASLAQPHADFMLRLVVQLIDGSSLVPCEALIHFGKHSLPVIGAI